MQKNYEGKMRIYLAADLEKLTVEGRTQISLSLKTFLEKNGCAFVESPSEADIIHFHSSGVLNSFKAAKWKRQFNKPVIYSFYSVSKTELIRHFTNHLLQRMFLYKRKTKFLWSYSAILPLKLRGIKLRGLDAVVVPSPVVKRKLYSNTRVIPLGIDTERFKPHNSGYDGNNENTSSDGNRFSDGNTNDGDDSNKNNVVHDHNNDDNNNNNNNDLKPEKIRIGFIGHPNVYKGVLDFARASTAFPGECEAYIYATVLSDKIKKNLLRINPRLIIFGLLDDIREAYHRLDIIALPYRSYLGGVANPLVLLEAMACGKAVITTDFEHIREIVQDSAIIIRKRSPPGIVKAAKLLADSRTRAGLGLKARRIAVQKFDQKSMFQKYLDLYKELYQRT